MDLTTPALLFPAISLLLLAYTNRFLVLAQVIRQLHASPQHDSPLVIQQIPGLRRRIDMIKYMQSFGVFSFLICALSMFALFMQATTLGQWLFGISIVSLAISLVISLVEVLVSTNALTIVVDDMTRGH